jgi:hypothetical protein
MGWGKLGALEHLRLAGSEPCMLKMIAAVPGFFTRAGGPMRLVDAD